MYYWPYLDLGKYTMNFKYQFINLKYFTMQGVLPQAFSKCSFYIFAEIGAQHFVIGALELRMFWS